MAATTESLSRVAADTATLRSRVFRGVAELDRDSIDRWRDLEVHSVHNNVYLSPDFLIPSLRHIPPDEDIVIVLVERARDGDWQCILMGIFKDTRAGPLLPFRYLDAYRAPHAYLTGLLVRRECSELALETFFCDFLRSNEYGWRSTRLACYPRNAAIPAEDADGLNRKRVKWHDYCPETRAVLCPSAIDADYLRSRLSKLTLKSMARKKRQLAGMGRYEWRFVPADQITDDTIDNFLRLENLGWKGEEGSSLAANPNQRQFFKEMIDRLAARGMAFFTEIRLDDKVIASTSNLRSGRFAFAFKLGWDPAYARQSVGVLNELELIQHMPEYLADVDHMDSGAMPGSFMDDLWSGRDSLSGGYYAVDLKSTVFVQAFKMAVTIKRCMRGQW